MLPSLVFVAYIFLLPTGYKYVGSAGADLIAAEEVVRILPPRPISLGGEDGEDDNDNPRPN